MIEKLNKFLEEEEVKIQEADWLSLSKDLETMPFGIFNPRWWKVKKQLHKVIKNKVIKSFRICDEN